MGIDPNHHVPIYQQIVGHISGLIGAGVYRPGDLLPSVRALSLELVVNPNTVQRAYQEIERIGLARTRRGVGMFVSENGVGVAVRHAESAARDRFREGVAVAVSADLAADRIEAIFNEAKGSVPVRSDGPQSVAEGDRSPTEPPP